MASVAYPSESYAARREEQARACRTLLDRTWGVDSRGLRVVHLDGIEVHIGAVMVFIDDSLSSLVVTKAERDGYEFARQLTFPGGRVASIPSRSADEEVAATAVRRTLREAGCQLEESDLAVRWDLAAPTRYTDVAGGDVRCLVLPCVYKGIEPLRADSSRTATSSIDAAALLQLADCIGDMADANRLIAYDLLRERVPQTSVEPPLASLDRVISAFGLI